MAKISISNNTLVTLLLAGAIILFGVYLFMPKGFVDERPVAPIPLEVKGSLYETQTSDEQEVTVVVTPIVLGKSNEETKFLARFDTHTIELDFDIAAVATLKDDNEKNYSAFSWSGGRGGHHLEGEIVFPPIKKTARIVTLTLSGVNGADRIFSWEIL